MRCQRFEEMQNLEIAIECVIHVSSAEKTDHVDGSGIQPKLNPITLGAYLKVILIAY